VTAERIRFLLAYFGDGDFHIFAFIITCRRIGDFGSTLAQLLLARPSYAGFTMWRAANRSSRGHNIQIPRQVWRSDYDRAIAVGVSGAGTGALSRTHSKRANLPA